MRHSRVDMVVVSREYGAGGSEFAALLGERLGWYVFDRAIVERVAERLHVTTGIVERRDEQCPGWFTRIASSLMISPPESPTVLDTSGILTPDAIAEAAHAAILAAAQAPPVIIVGHGSQCIFRDRPGTFQLRITSPVDARLDRIVAREGGSREQAAAFARKMDNQRQAYVERYYHHDWADPLLFDAQFNTARVCVAEAVTCVASLLVARRSGEIPPV